MDASADPARVPAGRGPGPGTAGMLRRPRQRSMGRTEHQRQGAWAEQRALRLLQARGWSLLARNWRCRYGELDLLLLKPPARLLLVEVKARRRCGPDGWGLAALDRNKRLRLQRSWSCWLAQHPEWQEASLELMLALVPLPPAHAPVRWHRWC